MNAFLGLFYLKKKKINEDHKLDLKLFLQILPNETKTYNILLDKRIYKYFG